MYVMFDQSHNQMVVQTDKIWPRPTNNEGIWKQTLDDRGSTSYEKFIARQPMIRINETRTFKEM